MNRIALILAVSAVALLAAGIVLDTEDGSSAETYTVTFDANGGSGGYSIEVIPGTAYYVPSASASDTQKSDCGLVGWTCDGVFYEIGQEVIADADRTYRAVWVSGSVDEMQMGTWSVSVTKDVFSSYQQARVKSCSITVTDSQETASYAGEVSGNTAYASKATLDASFTPSKAGTYFITVKYTVRYSWGDDPEQGVYGEYSFGSQENKSYTDIYKVTFIDSAKDIKKTVTWIAGDAQYTSERFLGDTITAPYAGTLSGTDELAWWTVNYYGTGDIYILPGTMIPVENGKNLTFKAKMNEAGYGAVGYVFDGGVSSTVQIASAYQIGSEITLPSDLIKEGYSLAGWTLSSDPGILYLPGTVIGAAVTGKNIADTGSNYLEMHAYWVSESTVCYTVTFQDADGVVVTSNHVPNGSKIVLPVYGFDSLAGLLKGWKIGDSEYEPGSILEVTTDTTADAVYPIVPEPDEPEPDEPEPDEPEPDEPETDEPEPDEPETDEPEPDEPEPGTSTCTVIFISGGAESSASSKTFDIGSALEFPKVSKAYCALYYWYDSSGTIHNAGESVTGGIILYAKWVRLFDLNVNGTDASVDVLVSGSYTVDWGSGRTSGTGLPENSSGTVTVTMTGGTYSGMSSWAVYHVGTKDIDPDSGSKDSKSYTVTFVKNGKIVATQSVVSGSSASKLTGLYFYYSDVQCTTEYTFGSVTSDTTVYIQDKVSEAIGIDTWQVAAVVIAILAVILVGRRFL